MVIPILEETVLELKRGTLSPKNICLYAHHLIDWDETDKHIHIIYKPFSVGDELAKHNRELGEANKSCKFLMIFHAKNNFGSHTFW